MVQQRLFGFEQTASATRGGPNVKPPIRTTDVQRKKCVTKQAGQKHALGDSQTPVSPLVPSAGTECGSSSRLQATQVQADLCRQSYNNSGIAKPAACCCE